MTDPCPVEGGGCGEERKVVLTESAPAQWVGVVLPRQSVPVWVLAWAWRSERRKPALNHTEEPQR